MDRSDKKNAANIMLLSKRLNFNTITSHLLAASIVLLLLVVLTSCGPKRPAYAPPFTYDNIRSDAETPKTESIIGKRQRLTASWYGSDFHNKPTASGEPFNMYGMTCAHREFSFGTILRVINPKNNKQVECTVNDRGPFVAGRDIDLSFGAARVIDIADVGVAAVDIEPFARDLRYIKTVRGNITSGVMTIQIGSFKDESNALRLKRGLEIKYQNVYILHSVLNGIKHYRVRIGSFTNERVIQGLAKTLAEEGYDSFITRYEKP